MLFSTFSGVFSITGWEFPGAFSISGWGEVLLMSVSRLSFVEGLFTVSSISGSYVLCCWLVSVEGC